MLLATSSLAFYFHLEPIYLTICTHLFVMSMYVMVSFIAYHRLKKYSSKEQTLWGFHFENDNKDLFLIKITPKLCFSKQLVTIQFYHILPSFHSIWSQIVFEKRQVSSAIYASLIFTG